MELLDVVLTIVGPLLALHALVRLRELSFGDKWEALLELACGLLFVAVALSGLFSDSSDWVMSAGTLAILGVGSGLLGIDALLHVRRAQSRVSELRQTESERLEVYGKASDQVGSGNSGDNHPSGED